MNKKQQGELNQKRRNTASSNFQIWRFTIQGDIVSIKVNCIVIIVDA